jgi:hypothetical protein
MMLPIIVITAMILTLAASPFASSAYAQGEIQHHGSLCNPDFGASALVGYTQFGIHNSSPASRLVVICGSVVEAPSMIQAVTVVVLDRNPTVDVTCTARLVDRTGAALFVGSGGTTGIAPTAQFLVMAPPIIITNALLQLRCVLPPVVPAIGTSHVISYSVTTL